MMPGLLRSESESCSTTGLPNLACRIGWETMGRDIHIPYLIRAPDDRYCAVRIVEDKLLSRYTGYLRTDLYALTHVQSHYMTAAEAQLLNEVNARRCDMEFGREAFTAADLVVRLEDAREMYTFLGVCFEKLFRRGNAATDRCGFFRIGGHAVVPYTVKGGNRYVPRFFFEGDRLGPKPNAERLAGWELAYLMFCCDVQGICRQLLRAKTCPVIGFDDLVRVFPPGTTFEDDYWPAFRGQPFITRLGATLGRQFCTHFGAHPYPPPPLTDGWSGLVRGEPIYGQLPPVSSRDATQPAPDVPWTLYRGPTWSVYVRTTVLPQQPSQPPSQYSSPHPTSQAAQIVPQPPPLVSVTSGNISWYSRPSVHLMGLADGSESIFYPLPHLQYPAHGAAPAAGQRAAAPAAAQLASEHPPAPARAVENTPAPAPADGSNPNYQQDIEMIDLCSPQTQQQVMDDDESAQPPPAHRPNGIWKNLIPIMEVAQALDSDLPFKIQEALVNEKMVPCINAKPFIDTELLMTVPDLVSHFFPSVDLDKCRQVLHDVLKLNLYRGNSQQMQVLCDNEKCKSQNEVLPLIQLRDVVQFFPLLRSMFERTEGGDEPANKRQRTS